MFIQNSMSATRVAASSSRLQFLDPIQPAWLHRNENRANPKTISGMALATTVRHRFLFRPGRMEGRGFGHFRERSPLPASYLHEQPTTPQAGGGLGCPKPSRQKKRAVAKRRAFLKPREEFRSRR